MEGRAQEPDCLRFATKECLKLAALNSSLILGQILDLRATSGQYVRQSAAEPVDLMQSLAMSALASALGLKTFQVHSD